MTLIEVVAGLVVMAVLVSAVTVARGRFVRQFADARAKQQAADAVDRMLAGWTGGNERDDAIPVPASGELPGVEGCVWRTAWLPTDPAAARVGAGVVRLEVYRGPTRVLRVEVLKRLPPAAGRAGRGER